MLSRAVGKRRNIYLVCYVAVTGYLKYDNLRSPNNYHGKVNQSEKLEHF